MVTTPSEGNGSPQNPVDMSDHFGENMEPLDDDDLDDEPDAIQLPPAPPPPVESRYPHRIHGQPDWYGD